MSFCYLTGDIGGTNSRLQLFRLNTVTHEEKQLAMKTYPSHDYESLTCILERFLEEEKPAEAPSPIVAALAVAGPVTDNQSRITNLSWVLNGDEMAEALGIARIVLVNDFSGIAFGLLDLEPDDVISLTPDLVCIPRAPIAVIGAGTGLGEAVLTHNRDFYEVLATEGGHCDFPARNALELELVEYMACLISEGRWHGGECSAVSRHCGCSETKELGAQLLGQPSPNTGKRVRVSVERIVSGTGLPHIYDFLTLKFPEQVLDSTQKRIAQDCINKGAIISSLAQQKADILCVRTLEMFTSAYGSEAGNLALKILPYGGLYVAGGIAAKMLPLLLEDDNFISNMTDKGRMSPLLKRVPVYVIKGGVEVGLRGSQVLARRILKSTLTKLQESFEREGIDICPEPHNRIFACDPTSRYYFHDPPMSTTSSKPERTTHM